MNIYERALAHYGTQAQIDQTMGEIGEFMAVLQQFRRGQTNDPAEVIDEIADVQIMMKQMEYMIEKQAGMPGAVDARRAEKLFQIKRKLDNR